MEEKKNRVRKIIYRDSIILLAGILYAVFVRLTGLAVPCIFRALTGWQCPGCGITRACLSLLKGEIRTSFSYNPFLYIAGPCIIYLIVRGDLNYIKGDAIPSIHEISETFGVSDKTTADTVLIYILIMAALIFGVVRNL
jgi:hypothetical protein